MVYSRLMTAIGHWSPLPIRCQRCRDLEGGHETPTPIGRCEGYRDIKPRREIALSIGLLNQQGRERLRGRIWLPEVRNGHAIYYQARALGPEPARHLCPPVIHRLPYGRASLSLPAPFDTFQFHASDIPSVVTFGNRLTDEPSLIRGLGERPLMAGLDADTAGVEAVERILDEMGAAGIVARRLRPPNPNKDPGEWAGGEGMSCSSRRPTR